MVTQPGLLLCDVQQQLEAMAPAERRELHGDRLQLLDEARAAFDDESPDLGADDHLDFERTEPSIAVGPPTAAGDGDEPPARAGCSPPPLRPRPAQGL